MGSNGTSFAFGLTNYLNRNQIYYLINNGVSPFFTRVEKKEASGDVVASSAVVSNPQGWGGTYTQAAVGAAQTSGGNLQGVKWLSAWGGYIGSLLIGDQVIKQSRDNFGAFLQNKKAEVDGFFKTFGKRVAGYMLGNTGHTLTPGGGFVFTTASAGTCTLNDPADAANIEIGQIVSISIAAGDLSTDIIVAASGDGFIVDVDGNTGVFHVSTTSGGAPANPANWVNATTYYAFNKTDFGATAAPGYARIILGFGGWIPSSNPTSTGFETTIDRTKNMVGLSGTRLSTPAQNGLNTEQRIGKLIATMVGVNGADIPTDIYVHPLVFQDLIVGFENRGTRPLGGKIAGFSYQKLEYQSTEGPINIWSEPRMPRGSVYAVNHNYIIAWSLDGYPGKFDEDGFELVRVAGSMDYEMRGVCYPAFQIPAPIHQGRCLAA